MFAEVATFVSKAQVCTAPSICLRFAMHALFWLFSRALMKFGTAIAANKPMMATTIMISTNVNPDFRDVLTFILLTFLACGVNANEGRLITSSARRSLTALHRPHSCLSNRDATPVPTCSVNRLNRELWLLQRTALPLAPALSASGVSWNESLCPKCGLTVVVGYWLAEAHQL